MFISQSTFLIPVPSHFSGNFYGHKGKGSERMDILLGKGKLGQVGQMGELGQVRNSVGEAELRLDSLANNHLSRAQVGWVRMVG